MTFDPEIESALSAMMDDHRLTREKAIETLVREGLMVSGYMTLDLAGIEADNEALDYPRRRDSVRS